VFPYCGIPISRAWSGKGIVGVLPSDSMTSIFVWGDDRTVGGMYAQRLDTLGEQLWDTNDVVLNIPMFSDMYVTNNCAGGAIGVGFHQFDFSIRAQQVNKYGQLGQVITSINDISNQLPLEFILYQNYPNPFNPTTQLKFDLKDNGFVKLVVYDILGREVKILVNEDRHAGRYEVGFNAQNLSSGIYFYKLQAGNYVMTKKLLLLK
jgi:hypothetical protein